MPFPHDKTAKVSFIIQHTTRIGEPMSSPQTNAAHYGLRHFQIIIQ